MTHFPSNSDNSREHEEDKERPDAIVKGRLQKKSVASRTASAFFAEGVVEVGSFLWWDVIIPGAKTVVSDLITSGVERMLYGESLRPSQRRSFASGGRGWTERTDYSRSRVYRSGPERSERRDPRDDRALRGDSLDDVILDTRADAYKVLETLRGNIERYGSTSVGDLYGLVGVSADYTDENYGWTDLSRSGARRVRSGFVLDLPEPEPLRSR